MDAITPEGVIGSSPPRIEGAYKVTGHARYGADEPVNGAAFAFLATAAIARGRVRAIDATIARALPGFVELLTHENVGDAVDPGTWMLDGGYMATTVAPLRSDRVHHAGQIVAVAVAETFEAARDAALSLRIDYDEEEPTASLDSTGTEEATPQAMGETELSTGDVEAGLTAAAATVDAWYETPAQHHNPMELFQTTCAWDGEDLTVWESSQNTRGNQFGLAQQLSVGTGHIRVLSHLVGGAFGSRGELSQATALVALAAKRLDRPVKLVVSRQQGFTLRTFRAETRHHLRLGADGGGHLTAVSHDSWELTGRENHFGVAGSEATARLYACPNIRTKAVNLTADRQTPGFMRAPPEGPYLFAMECAMDELAYAAGVDPLDLRRRNDTMVEPIKGLPYTSRSLLQCIDAGAEAFGWRDRSAEPGSMRDGDELVGFGFASAFYPTQMGPADARVTLLDGARASVEIGTHEIGTGIATVTAQVVADRLGLAVDRVAVRIGDSALPAAPLSAGSNSTATVCTVVAMACDNIRAKLAKAAVSLTDSPLHAHDAETLHFRDGFIGSGNIGVPLAQAFERAGGGQPIEAEATNNPHGAPPLVGPTLVRRGLPVLAGGTRLKDRLQFAFGAQFVEVRVDRATGEIRVPRMVGAFAAGRIMNPRTARSQLMGGQIWGLSAALLEATEVDERFARYVNDDLAEYHVPVCADIGTVETIMIPEEDRLVNPLGIKGVGELGLTGANAAVANAVFHATGVRVRKLPIRLDALLESPFLA